MEHKEITDAKYGWVDFKNTQHRYILSVCYQLGWVVMSEKLGRMVVDPGMLGGWVKHYSKYKKPILQHSKQELGTVILALEQMLSNRLK